MEKTNLRELDLEKACLGAVKGNHYDLAILPWGATEPHNQHLPYLTDSILSHDVAVDAARKALERHGVRAMVMAPIDMGAQNPGQRELPFCVHYSYETQKGILTDIVASLLRQGVKRLLIVNGHGGNSFKNMIRDLTVSHPEMTIAASEWFKVLPAKEYFEDPGDHADELETSVMMHYHPELVNLADAGDGHQIGRFRSELLRKGVAWVPRAWNRISADTGIGSPLLATAEKGQRFAEAVSDVYADLLRDLTAPDLYEEFGNSQENK